MWWSAMEKSDSLNLWAAHLAFLALFPGFFLYHTALGIGAIGPVLAGYFSPVCLAFWPLLAPLYVRKIKRNKGFFSRVDLAFFGFLLYFFLAVTLNFAGGADYVIVRDHLATIIHFATVFIVFRVADFGSPRFRSILFICLAGMTAVIFYLSIDGFFYLKEDSAAADSEAIATYQGFARSYFMTALAVLSFTRSAFWRLVIYFAGVPALFVNGARSELSALIAVIALTEICFAKKRAVALLLAVVFGVMNLLAYPDYLIALLPDNRALELLDLSHSSSWEDRKILFAHALKTIAAHPIFGDYGSYVAIGGRGSYAHNIFSAWVDLGFFGFLYLVCITVLPALSLSIELVFRSARERSEELILAFSLLFVTLLLLFTSKNFEEMIIAAAVGRYAHYRYAYGRKARLFYRRPLVHQQIEKVNGK
jgi:hypothetical protein